MDLCGAWLTIVLNGQPGKTPSDNTWASDGQVCRMQPVHMQVLNLDFCTLSELPASLGQQQL